MYSYSQAGAKLKKKLRVTRTLSGTPVNVDLEAARRKGIPVCNVPDYCMDEVADHALALILTLTRQIAAISNHVREGFWKLYK